MPIRSLFSFHAHHDENDGYNRVLKALEGVSQQMASIHDDLGLLKQEVVSLVAKVSSVVSAVADRLTTVPEQTDLENEIAQLRQVENTLDGFIATITTPPPAATPPAGDTPSTPPAGDTATDAATGPKG